jgi:hypothetical protein
VSRRSATTVHDVVDGVFKLKPDEMTDIMSQSQALASIVQVAKGLSRASCGLRKGG